VNIRIQPRQSIALLGLSVALVATACGSGNSASAEVASLGTTTGTATESTSPVDTQDALLKYAACMRENGIDMADPTFDADGNPSGGGFGPGSGIDPQSTEFQTAQTACGDLLEGVTLGGRGRNGVDREAIQTSLNDFTACLRDEGLDVDDITFGPPGGGAGAGPAGATDGSVPTGGDATGGGGFGPPPDGSAPANGGPGGANGPGGAGFDPTARMIEQLGLDDTDPAVVAALAKCQPILTEAFQPPDSTTTATTP
jgi:hypothetical protein